MNTLKLGDMELITEVPSTLSILVGWNAIWQWNQYIFSGAWSNKKRECHGPVVNNNQVYIPQHFLSEIAKPGVEPVFGVLLNFLNQIITRPCKKIPVASRLVIINIAGQARLAANKYNGALERSMAQSVCSNMVNLDALVDLSDPVDGNLIFGKDSLDRMIQRFKSELRSIGA